MASTGEVWRLGRRPELDGLRGVAVLLVLVGHAGIPLGLGAVASAGVTLFFVLSGYLITRLLTAELERTGRVDLRRFYARRLTRLAPPLFVMLVVCGVLLTPGWGTLLSASSWTGNYATLAGVDMGAFAHTWSLAVEEQFYLLWPLALVVILRRRSPATTMLILAVVLLAWRAALFAAGQVIYSYVSLETAGASILLGAAVGLGGWRLSSAWAGVGMLGVVGCGLWSSSAGGDAWALAPLLSAPFAGLMLAAAPGARWLRARPLTWAGVVSYSLYLWHAPVSYLLSDRFSTAGVLAGAAVGVAAYLLVEAPLMHWRSERQSVARAQAVAIGAR